MPGWRETGLAREALVSTPAVWRGAALVAAPLVQAGTGFTFRRISALTPPWAVEIMR